MTHNSSVFFWLKHNILSTKVAHQSANFANSLPALKFTKFLMSFFESRVSFSSNFRSLFSVMRHNNSVLFHLKLWPHQSTIFQTSQCCNESSPNSSCHFWNHKVRIYSKFALLSVSWKIAPLYFCSSNLADFRQNEAIKNKFSHFSELGENSPNSSCNIWNHKSVFFNFQHHSSVSWEITLLCFFGWNFIWFGQKGPSKVQILRLSSVESKFVKLFMSYFKAQVSSSSNFASFFSVMTHNSSVLFWRKHKERNPSKSKFSDFRLLTWNFTKFVLS